ncbi:MAG: hypothetical protein QOJ82_408 [Solirubrobacteraceae bacterium]|jgi:nucleotide-binding universal stress UspA family protein|nr:hypothetical protein [Solirubrobacteraceae bacterium]MEA2392517.1 hypothetical protein [Solirubrobacteraceae bacterium]
MSEATRTGRGVVIVGYDGSDDAERAVAATAALFPGARAVVVTVWRPILEAILAVSLGPAPVISDPADADERQRRAAEDLARQGARRATAAGLRAEPVAVRGKGPIWEVIEEVARDHDAAVITCGRGKESTRLELLGSVAAGLVAHASRPVLVVPSPEAAARRRVA